MVLLGTPASSRGVSGFKAGVPVRAHPGRKQVMVHAHGDLPSPALETRMAFPAPSGFSLSPTLAVVNIWASEQAHGNSVSLPSKHYKS